MEALNKPITSETQDRMEVKDLKVANSVDYATDIAQDNYLSHHGILGMKWGKRNGPPYPLAAEDHSASEKKARWRKSIDRPAKKAHTKSSSGKEDSGSEKKSLTDNQKRAIKIVAAALATLVVAHGMYKLNKSGKLDPMIEKGRDVLDKLLGKPEFREQKIGNIAGVSGDAKSLGFKKKLIKEAPEKFIDKINPKFSSDVAYQHNCGNCALAFELQSRGLNVEARGNPTGMTMANMGRFFKGIKSESFCEINNVDVPAFDTVKSYSDLRNRGQKVYEIAANKISDQFKDGSRGAMLIPLRRGAHLVNWEKQGQFVKVYDAQDPKRDVLDVFGQYMYHRNSIDTAFTALRLDDLELNTELEGNAIHNVVKSVGTKATRERFDTYTEYGEGFILKDRIRR